MPQYTPAEPDAGEEPREQPWSETDRLASALAQRLSASGSDSCDGAHDRLLELIRRWGLHLAINAFSAGQVDAWMESEAEVLVDAAFAPAGRGDLGFDIVPIGPEGLGAPLPLEWIKAHAHLHESGLAVWVIWYDDRASAPTPIVVAADRHGCTAGWTIEVETCQWWPILSGDFGLSEIVQARLNRGFFAGRSQRHVLVQAFYCLTERIAQLQRRIKELKWERGAETVTIPPDLRRGTRVPHQRHVQAGDPT